jgi:hypothetical protein
MQTRNPVTRPLLAVAALALAAGWAPAADDPAALVKSAAGKLTEQGSYAWTTTTENLGGGGQFQQGPRNGKIDKAGIIHMSWTFGQDQTPMEALIQGEKVAMKTQEGWQSAEEMQQQAQAGGGGGRGGGFMARGMRNTKAPAVQAAELAGKATGWKKNDDGSHTATLPEEAVKEMVTFGGRGGQGGAGPEISGAKGTVQFWLKDGALGKMTIHTEAKLKMGEREFDVNRNTTTEIKNVGTTKVAVPDEAKKKL